jgi:PucR family transcriptional regulator, purine catabolism regulatory protein
VRDLHAKMLGAVLDGDGLQGVAELAAIEAGGPVAIMLPARGLEVRWPLESANGAEPEVEVPILAGDDRIGSVLVLASGNGVPEVDREEVARAAALAAVTEIAVADARDEVQHELRASLIEDLRAGEAEGAVGRAARLGCDLGRGALAVAAEIRSQRPRGAAALIESEWPGSLAELIEDRVFAVLPARGGDDAPERSLAEARRLTARLRTHGPAAVSSFYADPAELHQAVREAELVLEVVRRDDRLAEQIEAGAGDGVYRLLFRALISDPDEVKSFYEDTVAPLVEYDRQYRSELLSTLEAYLAEDCNMNATARSIFAHRHTVAYRLDKVRDLSGLDPSSSTDRERLGLGIKAYRILAPTLHR